MTGFNSWVEIFQGGPQTDSSGKTHDGDQLIDRAIATFDPQYHEPPAVIGHPQHDDPAFGMVSAVMAGTRDGKKVLLAKFRDVDPEFAGMVKSGRFPKRSAAFYPDGRLRHVGFLGAMPPAVKGLKNIRFNDDGAQAATFEFSTGALERPKKEARSMTFAEIMDLLKFWESSKKPAVEPEPKPKDAAGQTPAMFSEADLEAAKKAAAADAAKLAKAEFAETQRKVGIAEFCEQLIKDGKMPPSWKDAGIVSFMQGLPSGEIEFSEGKKQAPLDWFKTFLTGFGKAPLFSEIAAKEKAGNGADFSEAKKQENLGRRIAAKVGGGKKE